MVKLSLAPSEHYSADKVDRTKRFGGELRRLAGEPEARPRRYHGRGELHESLAAFSGLSEPFLSLSFAGRRPTKSLRKSRPAAHCRSGFLPGISSRSKAASETRPTLKFILDTGSTISIVGQRIAQKLRLGAHPAQSFNFDRNLQWETATVPEVQFGPIRAANVAVLVGDLARYSEFAGKADAIIGLDLLQLSNFTIDFGAGHLIFDPGPPKTYLAGGDPMTKCLIVELQVQDRPVHLMVDTGLQGILLYEERLRRSVPGLRTSGSIKNATMGGRVHRKTGHSARRCLRRGESRGTRRILTVSCPRHACGNRRTCGHRGAPSPPRPFRFLREDVVLGVSHRTASQPQFPQTPSSTKSHARA